MRVLSVIHYPIFGGPHNRNARVARMLEGYGVKTWVLLPEGAHSAAQRIEKHGTATLRIPLARLRRSLDPRAHWSFIRDFKRNVDAIRTIIRTKEVDVVVINGFANPHCAIAANRENVPVVWQLIDNTTPFVIKLFMRKLLARTVGVVMATDRKTAVENLGGKFPDKELFYFNPPVDIKAFFPEREQRKKMRRRLGFEDSDFVVGYIANINPLKGHLTFVEAAAQLRVQVPESRFLLIGQTYPHHGWYFEKLQRAIERVGMNIGEDILIIDPGSDVAGITRAMDIYWMTSPDEGISTAAEEAMALGIPVISNRVGGMDQLISDGETGFLVKPGEISSFVQLSESLCVDEELRIAIGQNAYGFARQNCSLECCAQKHYEAYLAAQRLSTNSRGSIDPDLNDLGGRHDEG